MKLHRLLSRVLLLLVLGGMVWLYWAGRELGNMPRLQASNGRLLLPAGHEPFDHFVGRAQSVITPVTPSGFPVQTVSWRLPFELKPPEDCDPARNRGVLLFHGLTDSPFSLRDMAVRLARHCQTVRVMLLPGHATVPGDLSVVTLEEWRLSVDRAVGAFRQQYPGMLLGGYSLGGALAVDYVYRHPQTPVQGLVLVAPALELDSGALWALPVLKSLSHWLPRLAWLEVHSDENPVKYESFPVNAAWQMARLATDLRSYPSGVMVPVWSALTADDATINATASLAQLCQIAGNSGNSRLLWYGHQAPEAGCQAVVAEKPVGDVLDYSHLALPFSPDNPVYGKKPLYYNCVHYPAYGLQWRMCKGLESLAGQVPALGEITRRNLQLPVLRRLTYNPAFESMTDDLLRFLDALGLPAR